MHPWSSRAQRRAKRREETFDDGKADVSQHKLSVKQAKVQGLRRSCGDVPQGHQQLRLRLRRGIRLGNSEGEAKAQARRPCASTAARKAALDGHIIKPALLKSRESQPEKAVACNGNGASMHEHVLLGIRAPRKVRHAIRHPADLGLARRPEFLGSRFAIAMTLHIGERGGHPGERPAMK